MEGHISWTVQVLGLSLVEPVSIPLSHLPGICSHRTLVQLHYKGKPRCPGS